jgi:CelD/BcsL family acetyltransferase involved in cellulose biosynthesis
MSAALAARPQAVPGLQVETIADEPSFLALQTVWNWLVGLSEAGQPFLRHEWFRAAWECFGKGHQLRVLVARDGAEPLAIAPLMLGVTRMYGLRVRQLAFIGNVHTPRYDFVPSRRPTETYRAIWARLAELRDSWDVIQLSDLPEDSRTLVELRGLAEADGFLTGVWTSVAAPYVPLAGGWEAYQKGLRPKHRSNLRNRYKRLAAVGAVDRELVTTASPTALDEAFAIEAKGWKGEHATSILARPETAAFYRRIAEDAAQAGRLRLHFLRVGGRRIAFQLNIEDASAAYVLKLGYDPEFAPLSPQNLLCGLAIEDAFQRGLQRYDFLGAREEWKMEWARHVVPQKWLVILPNTRLGRLLHALKFRVLPALQRERLYLLVRDRLLRSHLRLEA